MRSETITFYSDGLRLDGRLFLPDRDEENSPQPLIVICSGFTGLCSIHPARFARSLTQRGHACFGFDYRGFGASEGERGRVLLEEQVRDILHAVAAITSDERVDAGRVILMGWGMAAGLVLDAGRQLDGVIGLIAANGFFNGDRVQRAHRNDAEYRAFRAEVARERAERARTGRSRRCDPFDLYPLDPQSREYVDAVLRKTPDYDAASYSFELADSLLRWNVEAHAPQMRTPLLIVHGDQNRLHPVGEAESLHAAYGGPKDLFWLRRAGHTEFMRDEDPTFQRLAGHIEQWVRQRLEAT